MYMPANGRHSESSGAVALQDRRTGLPHTLLSADPDYVFMHGHCPDASRVLATPLLAA